MGRKKIVKPTIDVYESVREEIQDLEYEPSAKDVFNEVSEVIREHFVAKYAIENDTSMLMRFVSGQCFRVTVEEAL